MASKALLTRSAKALRTTKDQLKRARDTARKNAEEAQLLGAASTVAGAAGGALLDEKFAKDGNAQAMLGGSKVPTNAVVGGVLAVGGLFMKGLGRTMRPIAVGTGTGMLGVAVYNWIREADPFAD